ncbi:amino acid decarboxylase [Salipaludibacillus daqingensis]|uniref:amino acid decarboxylase n=1 Tax=Salipaludibacillus daqingensis TaxID=3041001 RepID=UPI002474256A|nr:amino acid decarboxylase [Salipaludibacillus daqingensis]
MNITKGSNNQTVIDVREMVNNGQHPKNEIIAHLKTVPKGGVTEIHVPHEAEPLVQLIKAQGFEVTVKKIEADHFCLHTVKI